MRCVQNGRLERKEREGSTHNNGIEREERERVYIAALACLPKGRRRGRKKEGDVDETATSCLVHVIRFAPERPVAAGRVIGFHL